MSNKSEVQKYIDEQGRNKASALAEATLAEMGNFEELIKPIRTTEGFFLNTFREHFRKVVNGEPSNLWPLYYKLCGGATRPLEIEMGDGTVKLIPAWTKTPPTTHRDPTKQSINARMQLNDVIKKQQASTGLAMEDKLIDSLIDPIKAANNTDAFFDAIIGIFKFDKSDESSSSSNSLTEPVFEEYDYTNYAY